MPQVAREGPIDKRGIIGRWTTSVAAAWALGARS